MTMVFSLKIGFTIFTGIATGFQLPLAHNPPPRYFQVEEEAAPTRRRKIWSRFNVVVGSEDVETSLEIGVGAIPGLDANRPQKQNQDAYFFTDSSPKDTDYDDGSGSGWTAVGVMDGHGLKGHLLTQFLAQRFPTCLADQLARVDSNENDGVVESATPKLVEQIQTLGNLNLTRDEEMQQLYRQEQRQSRDTSGSSTATIGDPQVFAALRNAFHQAQHDAIQNETVPAGRYGTTCLVGVWKNDCLYVANVGDSRAYRFSYCQMTETIESIATLTTTSEMAYERERIQDGEGRIDGHGNVWYGPIGIAMTRSLGNAAMLRAGVVPTPWITCYDRLDRDTDRHGLTSVVVVATDGIWDALSTQQVGELIRQEMMSENRPVQEVAAILAQTAKRAWLDASMMDEKVDDITCIVVVEKMG